MIATLREEAAHGLRGQLLGAHHLLAVPDGGATADTALRRLPRPEQADSPIPVSLRAGNT